MMMIIRIRDIPAEEAATLADIVRDLNVDATIQEIP